MRADETRSAGHDRPHNRQFYVTGSTSRMGERLVSVETRTSATNSHHTTAASTRKYELSIEPCTSESTKTPIAAAPTMRSLGERGERTRLHARVIVQAATPSAAASPSGPSWSQKFSTQLWGCEIFGSSAASGSI